MEPKIQYSYLYLALEYFQAANYFYKDVPWLISDKIAQVTSSNNENNCFHLKQITNNLPISTEQCLLEDSIKEGKYVAIAPCYQVPDHSNFIFEDSLELGLIYIDQPDKDSRVENTYQMTADVMYFLQSILGDYDLQIDVKKQSEESHIITCQDIILSKCEAKYSEYYDLHWIYGTGIIEPTLSQIIKRFSNGSGSGE